MIKITKGNRNFIITKNGDCCFKLHCTEKEIKFVSETYHSDIKSLYNKIELLGGDNVVIDSIESVLKSRVANMSKYSVKLDGDTWIIGKVTPKGAVNPKRFIKSKDVVDYTMVQYEMLEKIDLEDIEINL